MEFGGTVLLVSHDRAFLNEVATSLLVFEGDGAVSEYIGGYDDWQRERAAREQAAAKAAAVSRGASAVGPTGAGAPERKARKLSNKERTELAALPARIEVLESEQTALNARLADPAFFRTAGAEVSRATARLAEIEAELAKAYARWTELEG